MTLDGEKQRRAATRQVQVPDSLSSASLVYTVCLLARACCIFAGPRAKNHPSRGPRAACPRFSSHRISLSLSLPTFGGYSSRQNLSTFFPHSCMLLAVLALWTRQTIFRDSLFLARSCYYRLRHQSSRNDESRPVRSRVYSVAPSTKNTLI